ncbi:hypothetical protein [Streptomyces sp. NPDC048473]
MSERARVPAAARWYRPLAGFWGPACWQNAHRCRARTAPEGPDAG